MLVNKVADTPGYSPSHSGDAITVVGFGGCLILGYPLSEETGFLRQAATRAQIEVAAEIKLSIISLHSCPATKAIESLEEKVLPLHPDIVVLQFGQTDAKVAVRRLWNELFGGRPSSKPPVVVSDRPATWRNRVDLFVRSCAGLALGAHPFTSRADYRQNISKMVEAVVSSGAYPIVFTPFVFYNFLADAWARCYSCDIVADFAGRADVCIVDSWSLLAQYPRSQMLLHDGLHLSRRAHEILAECLQAKLVERIQAQDSNVRDPAVSCA